MWKLVKSELKYYRIAFVALVFLTIIFQLFEFFVLKTMLEMEGEISLPQINNWNSTFSFLLVFSIFSIWHNRIKEKRERHVLLLPLSNKQLSIGRFWFTIIPFLIMIGYFFIILLFTNSIWRIKLTVPSADIGIMISLLACYILIRDNWLSYSDLGEKLGAVVISGVIVLSLLGILSYSIQIKHESVIHVFGLPYDNIQYYILGLVIMLTTIFSYQKRKSYLS